MKSINIFAWLALVLVLAGCSLAQTPAPVVTVAPDAGPEVRGGWETLTPLMDEQGAVTVEITPLNLERPGATLDFQVSLETHSVELSMDLALLTTLTTDTGRTVAALAWDAPLGGHHVSGTLSFPAEADGTSVLDGAGTITLRLVEVDAAERVFTWER
ncbi:MAG TPA: hypothetical protein VMN57_12695 [Anaerolineales bacterium]|nr:hypothetical protein [Anaerolineales bacterium]